MSLITQCPACSTMFRVVPDQLRISEGWVRCGQCDEVFDANAHLRTLDELIGTLSPEPAAAPTQTQPTPQAPVEPGYDWGPVLSEPQLAESDHGIRAEPEPAAQPQSEPESELLREPELPPEPSLEDSPSLESPPLDTEAASARAEDWAATVYTGLRPQADESEMVVPERLEALAEDPPPSFMAVTASAPAASRWLGKKTLVGVCSVMALCLVAQVLLHERDRIAAASPALQPLLVAACEALSCKVSPPREIESIAIDSSAFTSVRPGVYLLQLSLKNTAPVALATPALELTLTDNQDRPLLRRVVLPADFSGKDAVAAGAELVASLPIGVKPGAIPDKIAGYKVLAFYP